MVRILFILLLIPSIVYAGPTFYERFEEDPGYDETSGGIGGNWYEVTGGSSTVDPDYEGSNDGDPACWGTQSLEMHCYGGVDCETSMTFDSTQDPFYVRWEWVWYQESASDTNRTFAGVIEGDAGEDILFWSIGQDSGPVYYVIFCGDETGWTCANEIDKYTVTLGTKYVFEYYYEDGVGMEVKVNGVSVGSLGAAYATDGGAKKFVFYHDDYQPNFQFTYYADNLAIRNDTWVGTVICGGALGGLTEPENIGGVADATTIGGVILQR